METVNKDNGKAQGNGISDQAEDLIGKGKEFADRAEDFIQDTVNKFKTSETFAKISGAFDKVGGLIEEKAQEFQSGRMGARFETLKDETETNADEMIRKVKEASLKIGDQVEDAIDSLKGKKQQPRNENGAGI